MRKLERRNRNGWARFLWLTCLLPALAHAASAKEREVPAEQFLSGEVLRIDIPTDTASPLEGYYPIDGAGMADLPITGRIVVAGKSRQNIEQYLAGIWAPYLKDTHVMAHAMIRIGVNGNVHNPGFYYASPDAVIYDVIRLAGGPVNPYKMDNMEQRRGGEKVKGGIAWAMSREQTLREAGIQSGDEIVLPIGEHIGWKEGIPLIATTLTIIVSSLTLYFITIDRYNRAGG